MNSDGETREYFEDMEVGVPRELGTYHLTKEEIVDFAEQWDPQPFHVDEQAAKDSIFGELVASGLHTMCICHRVAAKGFYLNAAILGGPGMEDVTFHRPVCPGDTLRVTMEISDKRPLQSRTDRGLIHIAFTVTNQDDETVMTSTVMSLVGRRKAE